MKELVDLTPLILGLLAAPAFALCVAQAGAQALATATSRPRHGATRNARRKA